MVPWWRLKRLMEPRRDACGGRVTKYCCQNHAKKNGDGRKEAACRPSLCLELVPWREARTLMISWRAVPDPDPLHRDPGAPPVISGFWQELERRKSRLGVVPLPPSLRKDKAMLRGGNEQSDQGHLCSVLIGPLSQVALFSFTHLEDDCRHIFRIVSVQYMRLL